MTAMSDGGCAGAGPRRGLSGWNRTSGAVTSETPLTVSFRAGAPLRAVIATVSPIRA